MGELNTEEKDCSERNRFYSFFSFSPQTTIPQIDPQNPKGQSSSGIEEKLSKESSGLISLFLTFPSFPSAPAELISGIDREGKS